MANIKTQSGEASSMVGMLNNDFRFDFFYIQAFGDRD